jgi:hypothetical protein
MSPNPSGANSQTGFYASLVGSIAAALIAIVGPIATFSNIHERDAGQDYGAAMNAFGAELMAGIFWLFMTPTLLALSIALGVIAARLKNHIGRSNQPLNLPNAASRPKFVEQPKEFAEPK